MKTTDQKEAGFTVVELLVTLLVASLFIAMFYQLYVTLVQLNAYARRDAAANNLAYANLRRYPTAASTGLACPGGSPVTLINASGTNSNYPNLTSITETTTGSCSGNGDNVLVVSEVSYANATLKATYAAYVD